MLTFPANSAVGATTTFTVRTTEDVLAEGAEDFTVSISGPAGGGGPTPVLGTRSVTTTITDDDGTPSSITLTIDPDSIGEDDGRTVVTVTATIDGDSTLPATTTVTLTLSGTADSSDYSVDTALASVTIPAGQSSGSGTLVITPIDDQIVEGDETIAVSGSAGNDLNVTSATITLTDGGPDDSDSATVSIAAPAASVTEGTNAVFTVTLSHQVDAAVTVAWSATSTDAADLGSTSGIVTFAANSAAGTTTTVTIAITDDNLSEMAESFTVTLDDITSSLSDQVSIATSSATATIAESDGITVSIAGPTTVAEGATTASYTVSLSGGTPTEDLTVNYSTANGTATAGSDYTVESGTLTFSAGDTEDKTFTVLTTEDSVDEPNEDFTVSISNPQGGGGPAPSLGTDLVTTLITDNDGTPNSITLTVDPDSISEDDNETSFTVKAAIDGTSTLAATTTVTVALSGSATASDYTVVTALDSITIPAGLASASHGNACAETHRRRDSRGRRDHRHRRDHRRRWPERDLCHDNSRRR